MRRAPFTPIAQSCAIIRWLRRMRSKRLDLTNKILICAIALWAIAVIAPDFARAFATYNKLDIEVDNDGRIFQLGEGAGRVASGLRIDTRCTDLRDLAVVLGGMGGRQFVRPDLSEVRLCVYPETGDPSSASLVTYPAKAAPLDILGRVTLVLDQIFGVLFILSTAWLVWRRPDVMSWGFFLYAVWFNPGQYYALYSELQRWPRVLLVQEVLQALFQAAGYCGFVLFALRFPHNRIDRRWRYVEPLLPLVGLIMAVLQLWSFAALLGLRTEMVTRASYLAGVLIDALVIAILLVRRFTIEEPADRQRTRWVFWGCLIGLTGFLFADSNASTEMWDWLWDPSEATLYALYLTNAVLPVAVFYAIIRHRVINVTFVLSRKFVRPFLWFVIGIIIVQFHAHGEHALRELRQFSAGNNVILSALVVSLVFTAAVLLKLVIDVVHEGLCDVIEHLFFRSLSDAEARLHVVGLDLKKAADWQTIDDTVVRESTAILSLASAALFRRSEDDGPFRRTAVAVGWPPGTLEQLPADDPIAAGFRTQDPPSPLRITENSHLAAGFPRDLAFPSYAMAIGSGSELAAICFFGAHNDGDDINEDELKMLSDLIANAASAYEHVEMRKMRERLSELEKQEAGARLAAGLSGAAVPSRT